jgi:mycothiol synthase
MSDLLQSSIHIRPFNVKGASPAEYAALNRLSNLIRRERLPDDPPVPLEEMIQGMQNIPSYMEIKMWCAWDARQENIVARCDLVLAHTPDNQHMAQFGITVHPEYRRQGLARRLLVLAAEAAQAGNRRLFIVETTDRVPAGEAFMARLGAQKGLEAHTNQLRIADLDRSLLERWQVQARQRAPEFEIGVWDGPYPEEQIAAVSQLFELSNQQPLGDLDVEEQHMTPEQLRQIERMLAARGDQRWTFFVIEKATGKFAGYTETVWNPNRPEILRQDMTGVFPEYRNKGLGRWLKAAMLARVLQDHPQVKYVRTGNADTNATMLKINQELGFRPYMADILWQIDLDHVLAYLKTNR